MIARATGRLLDLCAARRRRRLEAVARGAIAVQERALLGLVHRARDTDFGRAHDFAAIRSVPDYQVRVPLREYADARAWLARAAAGEPDVTAPGIVRWWVKTSGTTSGDKLIPVTPEALAAHRRGGWDTLLMAVERAGGAHMLGGPLLFLGGSSALAPLGPGVVGDLSGLVVRRLPPGLASRYSPGASVAGIHDWSARLGAAARVAARQDLRLVSGMPSWLLVLFDRVEQERRALGRPVADLSECWPALRVLVHGGVAFGPYRRLFEARLPRATERIEVYPASEGFVALQTERSGGLTLLLDHGLFYEFVPVEDLRRGRPRRHTVADVELDRAYAVVMTTPAGLWSHVLGDTVRFTARDPLRLEITGRVRHFVNAFGENVIVEEVEQALVAACEATGAEVAEFTVAPRYPAGADPRGGHDWLVEFHRPPRDPARFAAALDRALAARNTDYRTKRLGDVGLLAPRLIALPDGTFHGWLRAAGKLGDQHKVPRVTNDRAVADAVVACAAAPMAAVR